MFQTFNKFSQKKLTSRLTRALAAIIIGLIIVFWPSATIETIVKLVGLMFIAEGVISFILSQRRRNQSPNLIVLPRGIVDFIIGIVLVSSPKESSTLFVFLIGMLIVLGCLSQLLPLIIFQQFGVKSWKSTIIILAPLIVGLFIIFNPSKVADRTVMLIGFALIFYGISELCFYLKSKNDPPIGKHHPNNDQPIDIEYEEIKD